jgi:hypothetical protein
MGYSGVVIVLPVAMSGMVATHLIREVAVEKLDNEKRSNVNSYFLAIRKWQLFSFLMLLIFIIFIGGAIPRRFEDYSYHFVVACVFLYYLVWHIIIMKK